jgi:hypothetical protein
MLIPFSARRSRGASDRPRDGYELDAMNPQTDTSQRVASIWFVAAMDKQVIDKRRIPFC